MSSWGVSGRRSIRPDDLTDHTCFWHTCSTRVPVRFVNAGLLACREHALLTWSIVNEQMEMVKSEPIPEPAKENLSYDHPYSPELLDHGAPFSLFGIREESAVAGNRSGIVYFIRAGGRIKIGYSSNLEQRLAQYPPDIEVLYLMTGGKDRERYEHKRFAAYLADGREWFQDRPEVTNLIAAMSVADPGWTRLIEDGQWWRRRANNAPEVVTDRIA